MNNFKLCFSTLPCLDYNAMGLKELCDKFSIDGVEVRQNDDGGYVCGDGLNIVDIGTGICFLGYDENVVMAAKKILDNIANTDIKAIRIFIGNFAVMKTDLKQNLDYDGIVKAIKEISDYTPKEIWIETHNEFATGRMMKKLLDDVEKGNVKVIWDIIHPIEDGEMPHQTWDFIGDKIAHVHLKDGKRSTDTLRHDYEYTALGNGELPLFDVFDILKENEFKGYISLEWESPWRDELKKYAWDINTILLKFVDFVRKYNGV